MALFHRDSVKNVLEQVQNVGTAAGTVVGVIVSLFFLIKIRQALLAKRARETLDRARQLAFQARNKIPPAAVRVRQTDIAESMSQSDAIRHREALALVDHGEILAAAKIFEEIKFQRQAIDVLERNGYYDQAAEILLKLKAVNRVAILYERNNQFEKALVYFERAGLHTDSARVSLVLAKIDCQFYWAAAQHFARSDMNIEAIDAYSQVLAFPEMLELARTKGMIAKIYPYLEIHIFEMPFLAIMSDEDLGKIIDSCPATPRYLQAMQKWQYLKPSPVSRCAVLKKIILHENSTHDFWANKAPDDRPIYRESMETLDPVKDRKVILGHIYEIDRLGDGEEGLKVLVNLKMAEEIAFLSVKLGIMGALEEILPQLPAKFATQVGVIVGKLKAVKASPGTPEFFKIIAPLKPKNWPGPLDSLEPAIDLKLVELGKAS